MLNRDMFYIYISKIKVCTTFKTAVIHVSYKKIHTQQKFQTDYQIFPILDAHTNIF